MRPKYGTLTTVQTFVDGEVTSEKLIPEERVKVSTEREVLEEFMKFRDETSGMPKATFLIEHTDNGNKQGFFYVVKTYVHKQ